MKRYLRKAKNHNIIRPAVVAFGLAFAACSATVQHDHASAPTKQKTEKTEEEPDYAQWNARIVCTRLGYSYRNCPMRVQADVWGLSHHGKASAFNPHDTEEIQRRWGNYQREDSPFAPRPANFGGSGYRPKPSHQSSSNAESEDKWLLRIYNETCLEKVSVPEDCGKMMKRAKEGAKRHKQGNCVESYDPIVIRKDKAFCQARLCNHMYNAVQCRDKEMLETLLNIDNQCISDTRLLAGYGAVEHPLAYAIVIEDVEMVRLLLENGAVITDMNDWSCIEVALKFGNKVRMDKIASLLKEHGKCVLSRYENFEKARKEVAMPQVCEEFGLLDK